MHLVFVSASSSRAKQNKTIEKTQMINLESSRMKPPPLNAITWAQVGPLSDLSVELGSDE